ncbi:lachesin-like isoform X2 [Lineus longissimus]|uniref:lachesin-like isoform X2 n=1 Tax=Lineus longissimus TaxID=88925 RepID=UPI002B4C905A
MNMGGDIFVALLAIAFVASWIPTVRGFTKAHHRRGTKNDRNDKVSYTVIPMPSFNETPVNFSASPGDIAILRCSVHKLGTKTVMWRRKADKHPLTIGKFTFVGDPRININHRMKTGTEEQQEWDLIIRDVQKSDGGLYECEISTKPKLVRDVELQIVDKPPSKKYKAPNNTADLRGTGRFRVSVQGTEYTDVGKKIYIVCNSTGKDEPPTQVAWFKDGDKIDSNADTGVLITKSIKDNTLLSVLVIKRSKMNDAGNYVCRLSRDNAKGITVHVLNVSNSNVKRAHGTNPGPAHQQSRSLAPHLRQSTWTILCALILTYISKRYTIFEIV